MTSGTRARAAPHPDDVVDSLPAFRAWWAQRCAANRIDVAEAALDDLAGWEFEPDTGNLTHVSGRFFSVAGLEGVRGGEVVTRQPVICQPEIGILGILVAEHRGVTYCLLQAKAEPGNCNGVQLSPTVQATRSNYTQVHGGRRPPYLEHFAGVATRRIRADAIQSEQGCWFWHKSNRNMIVRAEEPVAAEPNFAWLPLRLVRALLTVPNLVNMDTRTVLSGMPADVPEIRAERAADPFRAALLRSWRGTQALHTERAVLSWFASAKAECDEHARTIPLNAVDGWLRGRHEIVDRERSRFRVVGVRVRAADREVARWAQPMLEPYGTGVATLLVRVFDGVAHLLFQAKPEFGLLDRVELAPTVQALATEPIPDAERSWWPGHGTVRFDTVLSEEGGRFRNALTRYRIVEVGPEVALTPSPRHRWLAMHQVSALIRHGHYFNVEARTLVSCLGTLLARDRTG
ncbi:NDP-hexose 2,3-dehydratase [Amycolatopsis sp. AA4]|uniref:NDP-hexose 2,3-dehydratase family protein n=1 Tax=Actinomycetes TaxID=1760 RepID=UPI0001B54AE6|nr:MULTISPECIES: NDP-hexose 2,3-dehydratase family protein [Actinomycetes]ATY12050.1 NDP-hexose 2,3-dehydratase [Amycolatopsis sp. AA4]EFL07755.1 predicted protein [Streptomyces sp. AA4]